MSRALVGIVGSGVLIASFVVSLLVFQEVNAPGFETMLIKYFDFINVGGLKIPVSFQVDQLSALFLLVITGIGSLIHIYSTAYMHEETVPHFARYFAYLNLFVFSMLLLVLGSNFVVMFVGWEGVGLCSYLLIGYWFGNNNYNNAAKKAFVMNRIGDLGFLLAVFWMLQQFGSITYAEVFAKAASAPVPVITGITILLFIGAMGKSAQIPLYTWLPDAMAGPTPVSALIHAATIALKQNDIKKVLAYSTVSQLGLMFLALGVGAYTAGVFHVMTHAFFKALLFLGAGSVIHAMHHEQDIMNMGGLRKKLPITHITFLIGCLAIAGIPPFAGFFSKDEILTAALVKSPILYALGVMTSVMTAFYMFRLYFLTFSGSFRGTHEQEHHLHESPFAMTFPLIVLAGLSVVGGWVGIPALFAENAHILSSYLSPVLGSHAEEGHHLSHSLEWALMGILLSFIVVAILFSRRLFGAGFKSENTTEGVSGFLANKWYVDELYDAIIIKPLDRLAAFLGSVVDNKIIDGLVNGVGKAVQFSGRQMRLLQSGQVGSYILIMMISIILFFIFQLFWK